MSRKGRRKPPGRLCWCCGRCRPNESFSRRISRRGVCSECVKLGREEADYRQHKRNIDRLLTWDGLVRHTQRRTFEWYRRHPDARVRAYAEGVKVMEEQRQWEQRGMWAAVEADEAAWEEAGPFEEPAAVFDAEGLMAMEEERRREQDEMWAAIEAEEHVWEEGDSFEAPEAVFDVEGLMAMEEERRRERGEMWAAIEADEQAWEKGGLFGLPADAFEVDDELEIPF